MCGRTHLHTGAHRAPTRGTITQPSHSIRRCCSPPFLLRQAASRAGDEGRHITINRRLRSQSSPNQRLWIFSASGDGNPNRKSGT